MPLRCSCSTQGTACLFILNTCRRALNTYDAFNLTHRPVVSNKEAIAVNQNWAGSVGMLVKKWNPQSQNASAPLYLWGELCNDTSAAADYKWSVDPNTKQIRGTLAAAGAVGGAAAAAPEMCLQHDTGGGDNIQVMPCNGTDDPLQQTLYDQQSGHITIAIPGHGGEKPCQNCTCMRLQEEYGVDYAGNFVYVMSRVDVCNPPGARGTPARPPAARTPTPTHEESISRSHA